MVHPRSFQKFGSQNWFNDELSLRSQCVTIAKPAFPIEFTVPGFFFFFIGPKLDKEFFFARFSMSHLSDFSFLFFHLEIIIRREKKRINNTYLTYLL